MTTTHRLMTATASLAAVAALGASPALAATTSGSSAAGSTASTTGAPTGTPTAAQGCPDASSFQLTAPSHTEAGGDLYDKQVTFGAYWTGGNVPAGTKMTLQAGTATVKLLNGKTYTAPAVAGDKISGEFPTGGAAFSPSFRLQGSSTTAGGSTNKYNVTSISYPVTISGDFGTCSYTVKGTATSAGNVTSISVQ